MKYGDWDEDHSCVRVLSPLNAIRYQRFDFSRPLPVPPLARPASSQRLGSSFARGKKTPGVSSGQPHPQSDLPGS